VKKIDEKKLIGCQYKTKSSVLLMTWC